MSIRPTTAPICKQLEEMNEEELAVERGREWTICKSDTGFWVRVDDAPFRYFGAMLRILEVKEPQWDEALQGAEDYLAKYGVKVKQYIFY